MSIIFYIYQYERFDFYIFSFICQCTFRKRGKLYCPCNILWTTHIPLNPCTSKTLVGRLEELLEPFGLDCDIFKNSIPYYVLLSHTNSQLISADFIFHTENEIEKIDDVGHFYPPPLVQPSPKENSTKLFYFNFLFFEHFHP